MMHSDEDGKSSDYEEVKDSDLPPDESEATVEAQPRAQAYGYNQHADNSL
jgi:hypothetical protein